MRRISLIVFLILFVLCVVHALWHYLQLPEKVASHFDLSGQPDGWSTKTSFITFYLVITGICALLFLGISFGISKMPVSLINMPNKDFWLSEERKQKTFDFMFHFFLWLGSATLLLLLDRFHQAIQVNLEKAESSSHLMLSLGLYIGFTVVWCIVIYRKYGNKGKSRQMHAEVQSDSRL